MTPQRLAPRAAQSVVRAKTLPRPEYSRHVLPPEYALPATARIGDREDFSVCRDSKVFVIMEMSAARCTLPGMNYDIPDAAFETAKARNAGGLGVDVD